MFLMKLVTSFDVFHETVLVRCDLNVPLKDGKILDDTRIVRSMKTICYLLDHGAKVIVLGHLGKVKSIDDVKKNSFRQIFDRFNELTSHRFSFVGMDEMKDFEKKLNDLSYGNGFLLENTRFYDLDGKKESHCDLGLAQYFASFADLFINDAFGTIHRKHASNYGISLYLPSGIGFLMEEELAFLNRLKDGDSFYVVLMGGAKVSDKLSVLNSLLPKVDQLLVGGAMAFTFLKALGSSVGDSFYEEDMLSYCRDLLKRYGDKIVLPMDFVGECGKERMTCSVSSIPDSFVGYDIGKESVALFSTILSSCNTLFWNGPFGVYENPLYATGTYSLFDAIPARCFSVLGGGDIVSAYHCYLQVTNHADTISFLSTGGGATLSFLANEDLPGLFHMEE